MSSTMVFTDSKRHGWHVLMQEKFDSCGPAAVAMVESLHFHKPYSEARIRYISDLYPGGWSATGHAGTQVRNLVYVLQGSAGLNATLHHPHGKGAAFLLRNIHKSRPAIVRVAWNPVRGHFIVCPRMYDDGTTVFLDPWYGLVELRAKELPSYDAHNGPLYRDSLEDERGTITHVITIT